MNPYLLLLLMTFVILGLFSLTFIKPLKKFRNAKILSVITFLSYAGTLFYFFAIDNHTIGVTNLFTPSMTVFMVLLRTFTTVVVVASVMSPYYSNKHMKMISTYLMPIIAGLNIIFLNDNLIAMFGRNFDYYSDHRSYMYLMTIGCITVSSFHHLYIFIKDKKYLDKDYYHPVSFAKLLGVLFAMSIALMQQGLLRTFFGEHKGVKAKDFTDMHFVYMGICVLAAILPYVVMRGKSKEDKKLFFGIATMAGFLQYFYLRRTGLSGVPLHLCNTAVIMMFIAYLFNFKGVFYFSFFVNILGAIFAIVMPIADVGMGVNHIKIVHFWYNHVNALALPILGISLGVYARPNLKMIFKAIGFFTIYFFVTVFLNAFFNRMSPNATLDYIHLHNMEKVDYFFTYSDFFIDKIEAFKPLKYNIPILKVPYKDTIMLFFPLYQILIYVVFVALMFVMWMFYDYLFQVSDRHYALLMTKRKRKMDMLSIRKLQFGGSIDKPLEKEEIGMIKIENFSKTYAGSKKPSVENFSLEIHDGEVFGFIGHNGSGKSTTIKSLVGIQSLTSGRMVIDGYDISKQPLEAKLRIGYVSDNHAVYEKLTGREYINYVADLYLVSKEDRDARIEKYVRMFNLTDAIDREIKGYSHGMKQKIVVIASLIHNPKVWVLDEPLTGLDPTSAFQIKECMREHANNGNIVFFSSHVIEVVEKICDRICIIQRGKLVGVYNLKELPSMGLTLEQLYMTHVAQANYNIDAPDATKVFNNKKQKENA